MLPPQQQIESARLRYEETTPEREANRRACESAGVTVHDTMEQLQARAERLVALAETPLEALVKATVSDVPDRRVAFERIIGESNDLQSWNFLPRGARAAATVARISRLDNGRELPLGTGFLVSPRLLMTNNHVLPSTDVARQVVVEFAAEVDIDNQPGFSVRYRPDPDALFVTDEHLDVSVVVLPAGADGQLPGVRFGWNRLLRQQGKIVTGEPVNIVGHPMGRLKEISIRNNRLDLQLEDFLHYSTDTEPGNSGSPVFNDQWEVVALHHSGVPKTDDQGRYLRKDGQVWREGDGDDAILWVGNEGARVSRILDLLSRLELDAARTAILDEMGPSARLQPDAPVGLPVPAVIGVSTGAGTALPDGAAVPVPTVAPVPEQRVTEGTTRSGLAGRDGDGVHLVFLHGRRQEGKDPARLRNAWTAGLNSGLTLAGLPPVESQSAWFPFYGDRLAQVLGAKETLWLAAEPAAEPAEALAPPADDPARGIYEQLVAQAAEQAGMPEDLRTADLAPEEGLGGFGAVVVGKLQRQLSWLAGRSGLDDATIALIFRDVAAYLGRRGVRDAVLATVAETMPARGRIVLVSHSLGTVVAMDLLTRLGSTVDVPLLVTAGSPLGMDAVYDRLLVGGPRRPQRVDRWVNAWCPADAVAIGCPLRRAWGSDLVEIVTDNPKDRAHSIEEYLGSPDVARWVGATLAASPVRRAGTPSSVPPD